MQPSNKALQLTPPSPALSAVVTFWCQPSAFKRSGQRLVGAAEGRIRWAANNRCGRQRLFYSPFCFS